MNRIMMIVCVLAATTVFAAQGVPADEVVRPEQADVRVTGVAASGDVITGKVENHSALQVRNPRILVQHAWIWADERDPGTENPGRSAIVTIPADIPPGGTFVFSHALPRGSIYNQRGHFMSSAEIVGFEQAGRPETSSLH